MKQLFMAAVLLSICVACGSGNTEAGKDAKPTQKDLVAAVKTFEDSLKASPADPMATPDMKLINRYADHCLAVYRNYPKSEEAAAYLDKAHVVLSSAGLHGVAVLYADTLIRKYPNYKNRPMVLQSMASSYDLFVMPRKKDKVKFYYELLLKENKNLPKEEKEQIQFRLDHIDLTFDQLIELQQQEASKK